MLNANWPHAVIVGILVVYFQTVHPRAVWPETVIFWAWLPYMAHLALHHIVDGFQTTTRNIARITLIGISGRDYDRRRVAPIQMALVPPFMTSVTLAGLAARFGSFAVLLYFQGWGTALAAELAPMLLGWVIPIRYAFHLKPILRHTGDSAFTESRLLQQAGVSPEAIRAVVTRAVTTQIDLQQWWAELSQG